MSRILTDRERAERLATNIGAMILAEMGLTYDFPMSQGQWQRIRANTVDACRRELTAQRKAVQLRTKRSKT